MTKVKYGNGYEIKTSYDSLGNVLQNTSSYGNFQYDYDSSKPHAVTTVGGEFESFEYDNNGNMTKDANREMIYNAANQLVKVVMKNGAEVSYDYDYAGTRVLKKVATKNINGEAVSYSTHYLGSAIEIKLHPIIPSPSMGEGQGGGEGEGEVTLHIYANNQMVASRYLGKVNEVIGNVAGTSWWWPLDGAGVREILPRLQIAMLMALLIVLFPGIREKVVVPAFRSGFGVAGFSLRASVIAFVRLLFGGSRGGALSPPAVIARSLRRSNPAHICHSRESGNPPYALALRFASLCLIAIIIVHPTLALAGDAGLPLKPVNDVDFLIYHHGDHLGSTHLITEGKAKGYHSGIMFLKGTVIQRFEYAPWGQERFALNPNHSYDPRFTGQEYDIETGLYFYKARYYNPALGRFIQPDTIVPDPADPQSYNRYSYVRNNPLKYVDPSGHRYEQFYEHEKLKIDPETQAILDRFNAEEKADAWLRGDGNYDKSGGLAGNTTNANDASMYGALATALISSAVYASVMRGLGLIGQMQDWLGPDIQFTPEEEMIMSAAMMSGGIGWMGRGKNLLGLAKSETRALSAIRFTQKGEKFIRYESVNPAFSRMTPSGGVTPGTYASPLSEGIISLEQRAKVYNLPSPDIPRTNTIILEPPAGTPIIGQKPVTGGTGNEVIFPFGF